MCGTKSIIYEDISQRCQLSGKRFLVLRFFFSVAHVFQAASPVPEQVLLPFALTLSSYDYRRFSKHDVLLQKLVKVCQLPASVKTPVLVLPLVCPCGTSGSLWRHARSDILIVGSADVILLSSVIFPSCIGTLKSHRTRTFFPEHRCLSRFFSFVLTFLLTPGSIGYDRLPAAKRRRDPLHALRCAMRPSFYYQRCPHDTCA